MPTLFMLIFLSSICMVLFAAMIYFAEGSEWKVPGEGDPFTQYDCSMFEVRCQVRVAVPVPSLT